MAHQGDVRVVIVTAGDGFIEAVERETGNPKPKPTDFLNYGGTRLNEAKQAIERLGHGRIRLDLLGFPDGGIHQLLRAHWKQRHPERSTTTGQIRVPYPEATDRRASYDGADLRHQMVMILRSFRPTLVVFPDAMDWHPDHDGTGLFALLALDEWLASVSAIIPKKQAEPRLLAYLVHWYHQWPIGPDVDKPFGLSDQPLYLPDDLPQRGHERTCFNLSPRQRLLKRDALARYNSQQQIMSDFLSAFVRTTECYSVLKLANAKNVEAMLLQRQRLQYSDHEKLHRPWYLP